MNEQTGLCMHRKCRGITAKCTVSGMLHGIAETDTDVGESATLASVGNCMSTNSSAVGLFVGNLITGNSPTILMCRNLGSVPLSTWLRLETVVNNKPCPCQQWSLQWHVPFKGELLKQALLVNGSDFAPTGDCNFSPIFNRSGDIGSLYDNVCCLGSRQTIWGMQSLHEGDINSSYHAHKQSS